MRALPCVLAAAAVALCQEPPKPVKDQVVEMKVAPAKPKVCAIPLINVLRTPFRTQMPIHKPAGEIDKNFVDVPAPSCDDVKPASPPAKKTIGPPINTDSN